MSLVFAAIVPHPPLLIPNIGKENLENLHQTKHALEKLEQELYLKKPDVIMIIGPHEGHFEEAFSINAHTHLESAFEEFGDLETIYKWKGAPEIGARIQHHADKERTPVRLVSTQKVGHGTSVPLTYLTEHLPDVKILPVGYSRLDTKAHLEFGELLKDIVMQSDKRFAIIASGDLAHTKKKPKRGDDPHPFDKTLTEMIATRNTVGLMGMDPAVIEDAQECGYRSILIMMGMLQRVNYKFKQLAYEAPFGVGYLTGELII